MIQEEVRAPAHGGAAAHEQAPADARHGLRERRQQERLHLDSLHARLHGLRLILAMAQLNVAANTELERGERVERSARLRRVLPARHHPHHHPTSRPHRGCRPLAASRVSGWRLPCVAVDATTASRSSGSA